MAIARHEIYRANGSLRMNKPMQIKAKDFRRLVNYYQARGEPYIRPDQTGDKVLYVGKSVVSEVLCLYTKPIDCEHSCPRKKTAHHSASDAKEIVDALIPSYFFNVGKRKIGELGSGFSDHYGKATDELTFPRLLEVSLLQQYFDNNRIPYL